MALEEQVRSLSEELMQCQVCKDILSTTYTHIGVSCAFTYLKLTQYLPDFVIVCRVIQ